MDWTPPVKICNAVNMHSGNAFRVMPPGWRVTLPNRALYPYPVAVSSMQRRPAGDS